MILHVIQCFLHLVVAAANATLVYKFSVVSLPDEMSFRNKGMQGQREGFFPSRIKRAHVAIFDFYRGIADNN